MHYGKESKNSLIGVVRNVKLAKFKNLQLIKIDVDWKIITNVSSIGSFISGALPT